MVFLSFFVKVHSLEELAFVKTLLVRHSVTIRVRIRLLLFGQIQWHVHIVVALLYDYCFFRLCDADQHVRHVVYGNLLLHSSLDLTFQGI